VRFKTLSALSLLSLVPLTSSDAAINPGGGSWTNVSVVGFTACTAARCPPHGWVTVQLSANASGNPPPCSSDHRDSVAIDTEGKAEAFAVTMLQAGILMGATFSVKGAGACSVDAAIETAGIVTESPPKGSAVVATQR
jgi:hypothetical protein